jgi:hypothetical protein
MTLVCCWLDYSFGRARITAIADTRACLRLATGAYQPLSETTTKLFRLRVHCHDLASLDPDTGTWARPYYTTQIGLGFAGYCFEALSIIALVRQTLEELVTEGGRPRPTAQGLVELIAEVTKRFFENHTNPDEQEVDFLVFGYASGDRKPWLRQVSHRGGKGVTISELSLGPDDLHVIGSVSSNTNYVQAIAKLRRQINRHRSGLKLQPGADGMFDYELEQARHVSAEKKSIEEEAIAKVESAFARDVGGVLQKLEAYEAGGSTVVAFSRDDRPYALNHLTMVGPGLGFVPIGERMGRR